MPSVQEFLLGEFQRTFDDRYRLSIPNELGDALAAESADCILAKERPGCLSLWSATVWQARLDEGVELVKQKMRAGKLQERIGAGAAFRPAAFDPAPERAIGRPRPAGDSRGISRVSRRGAGRRSADYRGRGVRRDLEPRGVAEISRRPHAAIPPTVRSTVEVGHDAGTLMLANLR